MRLHDHLTGVAHVLAQVVVQHGREVAIVQEGQVVLVEVVGDEHPVAAAVLHHDLRQDMRHACQVIMQAHGALAGPPRSWHSAVQVVTPYNLPPSPG